MRLMTLRVWLLIAVVFLYDVYEVESAEAKEPGQKRPNNIESDIFTRPENFAPPAILQRKKRCPGIDDCSGQTFPIPTRQSYPASFEECEKTWGDLVDLLLAREIDLSQNNLHSPTIHVPVSNTPVVSRAPVDSKRHVSFKGIDVEAVKSEETLSDYEQRHKEFILCVAARSGDLEEFRRHLAEYKAMRNIEFEPGKILRLEHDPDHQQHIISGNTLLFCAIASDNPLMLQEVMAFQQVTIGHIVQSRLLTRICDDSILVARVIEHGCGSFLIKAARRNSFHVASWLIDNGVRDDRRQSNGEALRDAVVKRHYRMAELLLERGGSDPNTVRNDGRSALQLAVESGSLQFAALLLKYGARASGPTINGDSLLNVAVKMNNLMIATLLLDYKTSVLGRDDKGNTPLHSAVILNNGDMARLLLTHDAPVSDCNDQGCTPLHLTVTESNLELAHILLENGATMSMPMQDYISGDTPLHLAVKYENTDMTELLLNHLPDHQKAVVSMHNSNMDTPLHLAVENGNFKIVQMLLAGGASVLALNQCGETPLHLAATIDSLKIVQILTSGSHWTAAVSAHVLNARESLGRCTALHFAHPGSEVYEYLAALYADIPTHQRIHMTCY